MASLANNAIPITIEHSDEYFETAEIIVGRDGDEAYITVHGLDNVVDLYLDADALDDFIDRLVDVLAGIDNEEGE